MLWMLWVLLTIPSKVNNRLSKTDWPTTFLPSLHARSRTTTTTPRPFNLLSEQERTTLKTSSPLSHKPKLTHQRLEKQDGDARRPCQTVPSDQQEVRPPAMRTSAAVPPAYQWVRPWWPSRPASLLIPPPTPTYHQEDQWKPPPQLLTPSHSSASREPRSSPPPPLLSPPPSTCWPERAEHLLRDWSIRFLINLIYT